MPEPVLPKKASTIILVRPEAGGGFEILLTLRPADMDVLGGFYVFPGGTIEEKDCAEEMLRRCRGLSLEQARQTLGNELSPELSVGHSVAAVRELFEEVGILFSVTENGAPPDLRQDNLQNRLAEKRKSLVAGAIDFRRLLESEGLYCDLSRPVYFWHRVTPEERAFRFDTRFYLAKLPADQSPLVCSEEVAESLWLTPRRALDRSQKDGLALLPPTIATLRSLAGVGSWQNLRDRYRLE